MVCDFYSTDDNSTFTIDQGDSALQKIIAGETNERREKDS
jgi:hypothetical protein